MVVSAKVDNIRLVYNKEYDENIIEVQNRNNLEYEKLSNTNSVADIAYRHLGYSVEAMRFVSKVNYDNRLRSHRKGRKLLGDRYYAMCNNMYIMFGDNYDNKAFDVTPKKQGVSYSTSVECIKSTINRLKPIFKENMIDKIEIYQVSGNCGNKEEIVISVIDIVE